MRIVQLLENLNVGGLEMMAVNLAISHRKAGHASSLYTLFEPGELGRTAADAGIPVIGFQKRVGFSATTIMEIVQRLRQDKAEVVHTHNSGIHHYGAVAARVAGVQAVINTRHGLAFHSGRRQEMYYRAVMPLTDAVAFVCQDGLRHYTDLGTVPAKKGHVVLNGIPVEMFQARRAHPGRSGPKIRFGTIARFTKAKAHPDLITAFSSVAREIPQAELHIWGYGELQAELLACIAASSAREQIYFHGKTARPAEVLQQLDVFVLSSISEGLPLVILEAMAAGLPVVSTAVGGVPEVAVEGPMAMLAKPGDPEALADAMRRMARGDLAVAGDAAYRHAARHFGMEEMQRRYEALYTSIIGKQSYKVRAACL